jgi:hypothetical protein
VRLPTADMRNDLLAETLGALRSAEPRYFADWSTS